MTEPDPVHPADLRPFEHVSPGADDRGSSDAALESGVYRVVGAADDAVTLLRVADETGRRRHTGAVVTVAHADAPTLRPAENPDADRSIRAALAGQLTGFYWTLRVLGETVVERPLPGTVALAAMGLGLVGEPLVPIPEPLDVVLFVAGAVALVVLSRRGAD